MRKRDRSRRRIDGDRFEKRRTEDIVAAYRIAGPMV